MSYKNSLLVELVVPKSKQTDGRIRGFYKDIGWSVQDDSESDGYTYVSPKLKQGPVPVIVYGQNPDPEKTKFFTNREESSPSEYAKGVSMPFEFDLVEICMAVPSNEDVKELYEKGGEILQFHTRVPLREYCGVLEFRFVDPFNYVLRVTVDPGWEA